LLTEKPENLLWLDKLLFVFLLLLTLYLGALIGQVFCLVLKSGFLLLENSGNSSKTRIPKKNNSWLESEGKLISESGRLRTSKDKAASRLFQQKLHMNDDYT
jgi:hypothetical protein